MRVVEGLKIKKKYLNGLINNCTVRILTCPNLTCPNLFRSSHPEVFCKERFLEISQNSQGNTCIRVSFLIKLQLKAFNFIKKETLAQVFSCEFCEISKNTFLTEHVWATASDELIFPFQTTAKLQVSHTNCTYCNV